MITRRQTLAAFAALAASPLSTNGALAMTRKGNFRGSGRYKASGNVSVDGRRISIRDFSVSRGSDVFVYLGTSKPTRRVRKLKSFSGDQSYNLPQNAGNFSKVFIYCVKHDVVMGVATVSQ